MSLDNKIKAINGTATQQVYNFAEKIYRRTPSGKEKKDIILAVISLVPLMGLKVFFVWIKVDISRYCNNEIKTHFSWRPIFTKFKSKW